MNLKRRIEAFAQLTNFMNAVATKNESLIDSFLFDDYTKMLSLIKEQKTYNPWFIEEFINNQFIALYKVTTQEKIEKWILPYKSQIEEIKPKRIGVIMAGNIPLVGFLDFISILISGNIFVGKASSKDDKLPKKIAEILIKIEPQFKDYINFVDDKLKDFDAIIATGSNNTARYFDFYFGKYPNIIRKSRNSFAVLNGEENADDLEKLADDILLYFGLGCRNVSKIFVHRNYNFDSLFKALYKYKNLINHGKYANNYDYNRAIYLLNSDKFLDNGFFMIKEDSKIASPISVLHYEYYENIDQIIDFVNFNNEKIQCIASNQKIKNIETVKLGMTQFPELDDYEDGINTIAFLINL